jgi:hypothetical protein
MFLSGAERKRNPCASRATALSRWSALLLPLSLAARAGGQSVLAPPPGPQGSMPGMPVLQGENGATTGQEGSPAETLANTIATPAHALFQWGALHLKAHVSYQFLYGTGIQVSPGNSANTFTHTLSPGLSVNLGPHWNLDYTPSLRYFSDPRFRDTLDHSLSLVGGTTFKQWTLGITQGYTRTDEPLVQTGAQTEEQSYSAALNATYKFADKLSLEMDAGADLQFLGQNSSNSIVGQLSDSRNYTTAEWLNYELNPKFGAGIGVSLGYSDQDGGFQSLDEQFLGKVHWRPGEKLTLSVNGGIENRMFLNSQVPDSMNPILSASAAYRLFEPTTLTLSASRTVDASVFQNQFTEELQFNFGVQQHLLGKLQASAGVGYGTTDYRSALSGFVVTRRDETTSVTVGLNLPFLKRGNLGTFYQYSKSSSSEPGLSYSSNQVGATVTWFY